MVYWKNNGGFVIFIVSNLCVQRPLYVTGPFIVYTMICNGIEILIAVDVKPEE